MYELPKKNHTYVCTVDVATGRGLDYSTFSIFDISVQPFKQVATYCNASYSLTFLIFSCSEVNLIRWMSRCLALEYYENTGFNFVELSLFPPRLPIITERLNFTTSQHGRRVGIMPAVLDVGWSVRSAVRAAVILPSLRPCYRGCCAERSHFRCVPFVAFLE